MTETCTHKELVRDLEHVACVLNNQAALLAGAEEICLVEDISIDALSLVAKTLAEINSGLCDFSLMLSQHADKLKTEGMP